MKRRRKHTLKRLRSIVILALLVIPLFYLGRRIYKFADASFKEKNLKKEAIILKAENDVLKQRIDEYKKGNLIETKAREDLGMIRKGEKIYLIGEK